MRTSALAEQVPCSKLELRSVKNKNLATRTRYRLETEFGILTRCGLHCAPSAHKTLDTFPRGTVRFSLGFASTGEDVDDALAAIRSVCEV